MGPVSKRSPVARSIAATIRCSSLAQISRYSFVATSNDSAEAVTFIRSRIARSCATRVLDNIETQIKLAPIEPSHINFRNESQQAPLPNGPNGPHEARAAATWSHGTGRGHPRSERFSKESGEPSFHQLEPHRTMAQTG